MTRKLLLTSAAFIVLASGSVSFAADGDAPITDTKLRQIAIEPKVAVVPGAVESPAGGIGTGVQQIVVNPEGAPSGGNSGGQVPAIGINPNPAPSGQSPIGPIDVADTTPAPQPTVPEVTPEPTLPETEVAPQPTPETDLGATEEAPVENPGVEAVRGATALYDLLTARGYEVEILKSDGYGRYVFRLTRKGSYTANLLLVDGKSGEVLDRRDVRTAEYDDGGYSAPVKKHYNSYGHAYSPRVTYDDNCESGYGYQAGY